MKLTLRPEWRLWPLSSFLGLLDLKTGVTIALLFVLLNKVAGIYGLIAVVFGAGGSFAQLSLYIYSTIALLALGWGLNAVKAEDPKQTLYFAHLFFFDHILSTSWTIFFGITWWLHTPHDGRRTSNSPAQEFIMKNSPHASLHNLTDHERASAAHAIWNREKGTAASVIVLSWMAKIYFALLIYSYASHLRNGSYRSLPLTKLAASASHPHHANGHVPGHYVEHSALAGPAAEDDGEEEAVDDFYQVPLRTHSRNNSRAGATTASGHKPKTSSFSGFVGAPQWKPAGSGTGAGERERQLEEEVLFDGVKDGTSRSRGSSVTG